MKNQVTAGRRRLRELDLRLALGDIPVAQYLDRHRSLVLDLVMVLVGVHRELLPYMDLMVRAALPNGGEDPPLADIRTRLDFFLCGVSSAEELLKYLRRAQIEEDQRVTTVAFGIVCTSDGRLSFVEMIPAGSPIPFRGSFARDFCLTEHSQRLARIPLACRLGGQGQPERLDGVEFVLLAGLTTEDRFRVKLTPNSNRVAVALECVNRPWVHKEAALEFTDAPLHWSRPTRPLPPETASARLRILVQKCVEMLNDGLAQHQPDRQRLLLDSLMAACHMLRSPDEAVLRKAYEDLRNGLRDIGPAAEGFFAFDFIERLSTLAPAGSVQQQPLQAAQPLRQALDRAVALDNLTEQAQLATDLSRLAVQAALGAELSGELDISEEITTYLGIPHEIWRDLKRQASEGIQRELETLWQSSASPADASVTVFWLWMVSLPTGQLGALFHSILSHPLLALGSETIRAALLQTSTEARRVEDAQSRWRACRAFLQVTRSDPLAQGCFAHVVEQELARAKPGGEDTRRERLSSAEGFIKQLASAEQAGSAERQTAAARALWNLAAASLMSLLLHQTIPVSAEETEFLGVPFSVWQGLVRQAETAMLAEWRELLTRTESRLTPEERGRLRWLAVVAMTPENLKAAVTRFIDSTPTAQISAQLREELQTTTQRIADMKHLLRWRQLEISVLARDIESVLGPEQDGTTSLAPASQVPAQTESMEQRYLLRLVED